MGPGFKGTFEDYVNRGRSYLVLGRHERALSILNLAAEQAPGSYAAQVARAEALAHRGQHVAAVRTYEVARDIEPEAIAPLIGMASTWLDLGEPDRASSVLDQALLRQPENLAARLLLARGKGAKGDNEAARDEVERVIAIIRWIGARTNIMDAPSAASRGLPTPRRRSIRLCKSIRWRLKPDLPWRPC